MKNIAFILITLSLLNCKSNESKEITIISNPDNDQDAIVSSLDNNMNYSLEENNHLYSVIKEEGSNTTRVYLKFNKIPKNIEVDSSFLMLKFNPTSIYGKEHYGQNHFVVSRIVSPWDVEDITWNTKPVVSENNKVYSDKVSLNTNPSRINVTRMVQDISNDFENSHGFEIKLVNENENALLLLASTNHPEKKLRPELKIYYKEK